MLDSSPESFSPSFSWYAAGNLAAAAAKVSREAISSAKSDGESEFEFAAANDEPMRSSGRFRFPIFKGEIDDRDPIGKSPPSSSSSDSDEVLPMARYCLWTRSTPENSTAWCRKSKSTGSSMPRRCRLWSLTNAMKRSCSEGKKSFEFMNSNSATPKNRSNRTFEKKIEESKTRVKKEKGKKIHDSFYYKKKMTNEEDKRIKSYLPYRQDLVGIFSGLNLSGKNLSSRNH